ncbi:MAG: acetyl-CoA carboxylase carboxyl transferase subunit alpha, partial [Opitutae bacterium]|nr:acetyl-CoA carboxylase carboxyl transferase subunit alpha [Opitutae bacterium]
AHAPKAAAALKLNPENLQNFSVVEEIIPEPLGGAHNDPAAAADALKAALERHLAELTPKPIEQLLDERYARYRALGEYRETATK